MPIVARGNGGSPTAAARRSSNDGEKTEGGATYEVLTITPKGGKPFDAWFDAKTHLLAKTVEKQSSQTVVITMSDYRPVYGVMLPYKLITDTGVGENTSRR